MLSDKELDGVLLEARTLLNQHNELANKIDQELMANQQTIDSQEEARLDKMYYQYWNLIHNNFHSEIFYKIKTNIRMDGFLSEEYLDELQEIYKGLSKEIFSYQGYVLKRSKGSFGDISYFVYCQDKQYSDSLDFHDDEEAIKSFKNAIDENPRNPIFSDH